MYFFKSMSVLIVHIIFPYIVNIKLKYMYTYFEYSITQSLKKYIFTKHNLYINI